MPPPKLWFAPFCDECTPSMTPPMLFVWALPPPVFLSEFTTITYLAPPLCRDTPSTSHPRPFCYERFSPRFVSPSHASFTRLSPPPCFAPPASYPWKRYAFTPSCLTWGRTEAFSFERFRQAISYQSIQLLNPLPPSHNLPLVLLCPSAPLGTPLTSPPRRSPLSASARRSPRCRRQWCTCRAWRRRAASRWCRWGPPSFRTARPARCDLFFT